MDWLSEQQQAEFNAISEGFETVLLPGLRCPNCRRLCWQHDDQGRPTLTTVASRVTVTVSTDVTVCATCGKVAILRSRPYRNPHDPFDRTRPTDGMTHSWECPDGHGSHLTRVTCVGAYRPCAAASPGERR